MHCVYNATVYHFACYEGGETGFSSMLPACLYYVPVTMVVLKLQNGAHHTTE